MAAAGRGRGRGGGRGRVAPPRPNRRDICPNVALAALASLAVLRGLAAAKAPSSAATKARVEAGDGVPFFQERFGCREDGGAWTAYKELVQYSRLRIFEKGEGPELARALAWSLAERTSNLTEILQCNVGIIAGYHLLARHMVATADDWRAYSLLQLALIWVFTLRNANRVPYEAAHEWFTRSDHLIHEIRTLRRRLAKERARWVAQVPQVEPTLREPKLRIAVVSVCAYPPDHPLELKTLTPDNRLLYARRHGYALHVHRVHPMPDQGVHVQHAKLALMAEYLKSGLYDWVAWFDCDSIIMNMDRTLDSIIARYARPAWGQRDSSGVAAPPVAASPPTRSPPSHEALQPDAWPWKVSMTEDEVTRQLAPSEEIVAYVAHEGSCNTNVGCRSETRVQVRAGVRYRVSVSTALIDMQEASERLASVSVGGQDLGQCNPAPTSDYDCGFYECFSDKLVDATSAGWLLLEAWAVRTSDDCVCSLQRGECQSKLSSALVEAALAGNATEIATFGMFVKFTLAPVGAAFDGDISPLSTPPQTARALAHAQEPPDAVQQLAETGGEVLVHLAHEGSCNTNAGCRATARVAVDPRMAYVARVTTALVDMEDDSERLASVVVGGRELGECNPSPESDFTCSYFDCFQDEFIPVEATMSGYVSIEIHSVRTNNDCHCSAEWDTCYNRAEAALLEATGQGQAPPSHGLFARVVLTPVGSAGAGALADGGGAAAHANGTVPAASPPPGIAAAAVAAEAAERTEAAEGAEEEEEVAGGAWEAAAAMDEPAEDIVAYVAHVGSCNTVGGCRGAQTVRVDPRRRYRVAVATALIDMEDDSERLASVVVADQNLGECNPSPASDFDCGWFECFVDQELPRDATASGEVLLEAHAVRTSDDCACGHDACYASALAAMYREMGENVTDSDYGMFVRFTLSPIRDAPARKPPRRGSGHAPPPAPALANPPPPAPPGAAAEVEPLEDEAIDAYVSHVGSCNTNEGCHAWTRVRVNRRVQYEVTVATAQVDMAEDSERLASVTAGGVELGECNPSPEDDFDCSFEDCAVGVRLPPEVTAEGFLDLRVHAVRTSADCHCNRLLGTCYSAADAAVGEASGDGPLTDPRYGMFVRFSLVPVPREEAEAAAPAWARLRRRGAECAGAAVLLGTGLSPGACLELCRRVADCAHVAVGIGGKAGKCFWQLGNCTEFEPDSYDVYAVHGDAPPGAPAPAGAAAPAGGPPAPGAAGAAAPGAGADGGPAGGEADLLITEEGWGLSSANWLIRRSDWSINFLEQAFRLCHEQMPLFGDQDAMIHLLLNERALLSRRGEGALEPHAVVIPQHEINAYDALNAFYMEADAYKDGDLLITFPGCKEAGACNPLFRLAAAHARGDAGSADAPRAWPHLRVFGPPEEAAALFESSRVR